VSDELLVAADGDVRIVTINRPQSRNVIDESLHSQLPDVWHDLDRDATARCVVLTVREFLGADKYDAIDISEAGHE
jgi:enoyl-CoA hydratase